MPMQTQVVGEGIVPTYLRPRCYKWVGGQHHTQASLPPGKDLVPIGQEEGWPSGSVCMGMENLASTRIRSSDCPVSSESLFWLQL